MNPRDNTLPDLLLTVDSTDLCSCGLKSSGAGPSPLETFDEEPFSFFKAASRDARGGLADNGVFVNTGAVIDSGLDVLRSWCFTLFASFACNGELILLLAVQW